jgi:hypothetical protein
MSGLTVRRGGKRYTSGASCASCKPALAAALKAFRCKENMQVLACRGEKLEGLQCVGFQSRVSGVLSARAQGGSGVPMPSVRQSTVFAPKNGANVFKPSSKQVLD